jgi:hypothetical protein
MPQVIKHRSHLDSFIGFVSLIEEFPGTWQVLDGKFLAKRVSNIVLIFQTVSRVTSQIR